MSEQERRKELQARYKESRSEAGVYGIVNRHNDRLLLGSSANLNSVRSKFEFATSSNTPSILDLRLRADIQRHGMDAFALEVLEVLEIKPGATQDEVQEDLAAMEKLWREEIGASRLY